MAITTKARAKGLLRDAGALLADKTLPKTVSEALEAVRTALRKNWADLEAEAGDPSTAAAASAQDATAAAASAQDATAAAASAQDATAAKASAQGNSAQEPVREAEGFSFGDVQRLLQAAVRAESGSSSGGYIYIRDVYDAWFVYEVSAEMAPAEKLYRRSYVVDPEGKVTLGEPQEVVAATVYVPVSEAASPPGPLSWAAAQERGRGAAGQGQAGQGQAQPLLEQAQALQGDVVPLVERAVRADGSVPIKMIAPGWGSSGFYSAELLQRDGPRAFPAGTQMFWDHATPTEEAERPEGSLARLAAVTTTTPKYQPDGPAGPGLYTEAKVFGGYAGVLEELAPHIGVSIRGHGVVKAGEVDGRKGLIVEKLLPGRSVDFVTTPGAGGQVVSLFEAARGGAIQRIAAPGAVQVEEGIGMDEQELKALQEAKGAAEAEVARLREALLLREARDVAATELAKLELPEVTRARLLEVLAARPVVKEGALDLEGFRAQISETATRELAYLAQIGATGAGRIVGMGSAGGDAPSAEQAEQAMREAFRALGLSESLAERAARGR